MSEKKHEFPKHMYRPADHDAKFDSVIVASEEHLEDLESEYGEHHDSPADFGVETHPNPKEALAKRRADKLESAKGDEGAPVKGKAKGGRKGKAAAKGDEGAA